MELRTESPTARGSLITSTSTRLESDVLVPVRESRGPTRYAPRKVNRRERADFRAYTEHRDGEARERLIRAYLPLADSIARRFDRGGRVPLDDLKQIAALGLLKALERYDRCVAHACTGRRAGDRLEQMDEAAGVAPFAKVSRAPWAA